MGPERTIPDADTVTDRYEVDEDGRLIGRRTVSLAGRNTGNRSVRFVYERVP
ncbi:MAG: hypothetical protein OXI76_17595 [Gemmatimonadota bacterium]|nr:hypothetical protein [Gemmatimonadota bacterium]